MNSLDILIESFVTNYRGCLIYRENGKYKVFGKTYPTLYLAKKRVDMAYNSFNAHLNKDK